MATTTSITMVLSRIGSTISETGLLSLDSDAWGMISWGYGTNGDAHWAAYETPSAVEKAPSVFYLFSRVKGGPSNVTRDALLDGVEQLKIDALTALTDQVYALPVDERRHGVGPEPCNQACKVSFDV